MTLIVTEKLGTLSKGHDCLRRCGNTFQNRLCERRSKTFSQSENNLPAYKSWQLAPWVASRCPWDFRFRKNSGAAAKLSFQGKREKGVDPTVRLPRLKDLSCTLLISIPQYCSSYLRSNARFRTMATSNGHCFHPHFTVPTFSPCFIRPGSGCS